MKCVVNGCTDSVDFVVNNKPVCLYDQTVLFENQEDMNLEGRLDPKAPVHQNTYDTKGNLLTTRCLDCGRPIKEGMKPKICELCEFLE